MQTLTEAGPLYTGLAQGYVDIYPSAWPELTHKSYMDRYGDKIEDLGAYYDNAKAHDRGAPATSTSTRSRS